MEGTLKDMALRICELFNSSRRDEASKLAQVEFWNCRVSREGGVAKASANEKYEVRVSRKGSRCSCPAFRFRASVPCKHVGALAARLLHHLCK